LFLSSETSQKGKRTSLWTSMLIQIHLTYKHSLIAVTFYFRSI